MKKYHLVVKEENVNVKIYYPNQINLFQSSDETCNYFSLNKNGAKFIGSTPKEMTIEEINELPYGFVNMFNIVEVEDKKYHWRVKDEHLVSFENYDGLIYLNRRTENGNLKLNDKRATCFWDTKFTEKKAKELLGDEFNKFEKEECE